MAFEMAVIFITGPVSSGKSAFAVRLALESGREVTYIATAAGEPEDVEWRARLTRHVRDRPASWRTVETAAMTHEAQLALFREAPATACLVVDALGTWLDARIASRIDLLEIDYNVFASQLDDEAADFVDAMLASRSSVIAVSEQFGWDVVPVAASARLPRCNGADGSAIGQAGRQRVPRRCGLRARFTAHRAADRLRAGRLSRLRRSR